MDTSTLLHKNNRIRINEKTKLANLVNHILRNYKPDTIQFKRDFNANDTKNNLLINADFKLSPMSENWFSSVEVETKLFKDDLEQSLLNADLSADIQISLSRSEKDKTIKSINYFSKLKNYDEDLESSIIPIILTCLDFKNQKPNEKNYSIFDKDKLSNAINLYHKPPSGQKIKSLNAKVKNLTQILENVDAMKVANDRKPTADAKSIGFEETLLKIPKHNNKSISNAHMIEIIKEWHELHFSNFKVIGGVLHKDERTKKDNEVDDHLHLIKSGFNQETKKFDLPDFTFKKGLEMAVNQGIYFEYSGQKYNKAGEILRSIAGEAMQTEFYKFANNKLEKYNYTFRFDKKELTPEEQVLRDFLKEQSKLPKAQRSQNMSSYIDQLAKKKANDMLKAASLEKSALTKRNEHIKVANSAIAKTKESKKVKSKHIQLAKKVIHQKNIAKNEIKALERTKKSLIKNITNIMFGDTFENYVEKLKSILPNQWQEQRHKKRDQFEKLKDETITDIRKSDPVFLTKILEEKRLEKVEAENRKLTRHIGNEFKTEQELINETKKSPEELINESKPSLIKKIKKSISSKFRMQ
jgi:hypothetical protein